MHSFTALTAYLGLLRKANAKVHGVVDLDAPPPLKALCTCGHTLAIHDDENQCGGYWPAQRDGEYEGACGCAGFIWDNGKVK